MVVTEATNAQTSVPHSGASSKGVPSHEHSKDSSSDERRSVKKESSSTSPMAHQLLQVIDVLQTVDDDDGNTHRSPSASLSSISHGVRVDYATIGNHRNNPYGSASVSLHKISRRNRKQTMSPAKVVPSESLTTATQDKNSPGEICCYSCHKLWKPTIICKDHLLTIHAESYVALAFFTLCGPMMLACRPSLFGGIIASM